MTAVKFEPEHRGVLRLKTEPYGISVLGATLRYIPCTGPCRLLVMAAIHGEEPETTFLLSRALRAYACPFKSIAFVLCANPDGVALGTRGNANGVDLNRNFPTSNWAADPVASRSVLEAPRDTLLSPGDFKGGEPEIQALVALVQKLKPSAILSMHSPIGCVDAPRQTPLVLDLQKVFRLPWVENIGYPTPGSLGTWCMEQGLECVTLELPRLALELLFERYGEPFAEFLENADIK